MNGGFLWNPSLRWVWRGRTRGAGHLARGAVSPSGHFTAPLNYRILSTIISSADSMNTKSFSFS